MTDPIHSVSCSFLESDWTWERRFDRLVPDLMEKSQADSLFDALDAIGPEYRDRSKRLNKIAYSCGACCLALMIAGMVCILTFIHPSDPSYVPPAWTFVLMASGFVSFMTCTIVHAYQSTKIKKSYVTHINLEISAREQQLEIQVETFPKGQMFLKFSTPGQPLLFQNGTVI